MATSLNASLNVQLNAASLNASTKQVQQALGRITGQASEFQKSLDASTARVFAFGATTAVINGVTQSFKKLVSTTVEVQKRLIEINSIFQATTSTFNGFRNAIFQVAKDTGQSFNTVADGAAELARQGLSAEETAKRLKAALVLTRISGMDAEKSVKALTAAINGFTSAGLTANQIVNKMVAVDTAFAVSTQDLADAFSRAGSTAEDAGVSFDQLLGLVTAVEQKTARGGAVIGNAFKSIFTRLQRGGTIGELQSLGVAIDATMGGVQKLTALSDALEKISDPTISSKIKELAGGVFQINVVSAALKDLSNETSIYRNAAVTAANATNEAFEKNAALSGSIASQMNALVVGLTSLAEKIGTITFGPLMEDLVGIANKFTEFLDKALDPEKGSVFIKGLFKVIGSFLRGPAIVIFTAAFVKIFKLVAKFAGQGLGALFQIGTQTEKIKQIEGGIVGLLSRDEALRNMIVSSTATQVQKEQAIIAAIRTENALLSQQAQLMRGLAMAAASRGVSGFGAAGFKGKKGKSFASGYRQEEAMATMLGAKNPKAHKGKGTIGGRSFTMNNRETEIPRFGRNGDSAVIPHYARGFVPNFAGRLRPRPSVADIKGSQRSQFVGTDGEFKSQWMKDAAADPKSKTGAALLAKKNKKTTKDVIVVHPSQTAMLIPTIGLTSKIAPREKGSFKQGNKRYPYEYQSGLPVYGPKVPKAVDQAADPEDERLKKSITKGVTTSAANYAKLLKPVLGEPKPSTIRKMLEEQGGGKGALRGIIGAAFEAAVNVALNISPAKNVEGGDFDVKGGAGGNMRTEALQDVYKLFGIKNKATTLMDFKVNAQKGSQHSFAKKLFNQKRYHTEQRAMKAAGFIPNFAGGLGAAIEREKAAGIPVSKIRAHFDKRGMPKAVTNTGDEPKGLASLGFVPNYAGGGGNVTGNLMLGLFSLMGVVEMHIAKKEQEIATEVAAVEEKKKAILSDNLAWSEKQKLLEQNKREIKAASETTDSMTKLAKNASTAATALMTISTLNMLTGGGIGRGSMRALGFGKAGKAAWGAAAARSAAIPAARTTRMVTTAGTKAGPKVGGAGWRSARVGAPMQFRQELSRPARLGQFSARMGHKAKAYGMGSKFGGVAGKAAGRLGVAGTLIGGGIDIYKTQTDATLNKEQKKERTKKAGIKTGFTAAGAALGTMIPIPVLGTLIGGAVGAGLGNMATGRGFFSGDQKGESEADKNKAFAEKRAAKQIGKESLIGFSGEDFDKAVDENLQKMARQGMDTTAVQENFNNAMEARAEAMAGYGEGDVSAEELNASYDKLIAASMALTGATHLLSSDRKAYASKLKKYTKIQERAEAKLAEATAKRASLMGEALKRAKKDQTKGEDRAQLGAALGSGNQAELARTAIEGDLMLKKINTLAAEKDDADRLLKEGEAAKMGEADLKPLRDAAAKAGQSFISATKKAGASFLTSITKANEQIEKNKKKLLELGRERREKARQITTDVALGKKTDRLGPFAQKLTEFANILRGIRGRRKKLGDNITPEQYKMTPQERKAYTGTQIQLEELHRTSTLADSPFQALVENFLTKLSEDRIDPKTGINLNKKNSRLFAGVNQTYTGSLNDPIRAGALSGVEGVSGLDKETKDTFTAVAGQAFGGLFGKGGVQKDLEDQQVLLMNQIIANKNNYERLAKNGKTEDIIREQNAMFSAMSTATASYAGVSAYVKKISTETKIASDVIQKNNTQIGELDDILKIQNDTIGLMKDEIQDLKDSLEK
jgi:TP901 family phage tail tape measure protein